ncbi:hypothetical protein RND81_02G025100 [Saponaria officinalis]|uniref:RING-type E3 ubiquitin transferase n=1 Tax=Saponaria officinalis TaxID=3572 RepID=A0AAW1MT12_SAPOF
MPELMTQLIKNNQNLISSPNFSPIPSISSPPSSSNNAISPVILLIIVIIAVIFFVSGVLHLLVRFLVKGPTFNSSIYPPNNSSNGSNSEALQRQLQQLFRLHDSGLDQPLIDALPVFYYKDIMGLKEPFDCAVCLCKFCDHDTLRLLPLCSHAFHVSCIDTWLLSNSTCPLCRSNLLSHGSEENREFSLDYWREMSFARSINSDYDHSIVNNSHSFNYGHKPTIMEENASERRVFSVRLGKFKSVNSENSKGNTLEIGSSSSQLDARRCYSLGSYQYVLDDSDLQVALSDEIGALHNNIKLEKTTGSNENSTTDGDVEGKKISRRSKGESFSVSKIWLWSKKGKFTGSSDGILPNNVVLPLSTRDHIP